MLGDGRLGDLNAWLVRGFPGPSIGPFSAAIWQEGCLTPVTGSGVSAATPFPLGCLQDTMLGALFCVLADEGALSLDDPLAQHLPEVPGAMVDGEVPRLAHLLSHSTGLWAERPPTADESPIEFAEFCRLLVQRWRPGTVSVHSLLDRILLLGVAEQAVGRSVYAELRDRFAPSSETLAPMPPDGLLAHCYSELCGSLGECAAFLDRATRTSWPDRIGTGAMRPITHAPNVRPWAPVADGLGLFRLANGILGQDGDHSRLGFVGLRVSPDFRAAVIGHFRSSAGRDHVLNRLVSDVMDVAPPPRSFVLGDLNGFEPSELAGLYDGIWDMRRYVEAVDGQLRIAVSREMRPLVADIQSDGTLTGRWAAPNLWIEPQSFGRSDLVGFRFGKHLYVKGRNHARSHDG